MDELTQVTQQTSAPDTDAAPGSATAPTPMVGLRIGKYQIALLRHNILQWRGPAFNGVPLTQASIDRLDPSQPLVQRALQEITDRNKVAPVSPDPKLATTSGSIAAGAASSTVNSNSPSADDLILPSS
jgi:hypothetical protein